MRNQIGFSLLEVAVGLVVFALMLLTVTMVFALGARLSTQASLMDRATSVAEGRMEELRSLGHDWVVTNHPMDQEVEDQIESFKVCTKVEPYVSDILRITVQVHWEDRGEPLSLTIESFIGH